MPVFNEAYFFKRSRGNVLIFMVNPFWDDFRGQKTRSQERARGTQGILFKFRGKTEKFDFNKANIVISIRYVLNKLIYHGI